MAQQRVTKTKSDQRTDSATDEETKDTLDQLERDQILEDIDEILANIKETVAQNEILCGCGHPPSACVYSEINGRDFHNRNDPDYRNGKPPTRPPAPTSTGEFRR